jgi:hypothetical protein
MTNLDDDRLLRSYLLGELRDPDQERVEDRMFGDDEYYGRLLTMEEELIRDYARGRLPRSVRRRFERRLVASPDWPARVDEARALIDIIGEEHRARGDGRRQRAWTRATAAVAGGAVMRRLALAAAIVVVVSGVSWLVVDRLALSSRLERVEVERAEVERRTNDMARRIAEQSAALARLDQALATNPAGEPSPPGRVVAFLLSPGGTRSPNDSGTTLRVPADSEVRLLLTLGDRRGHSGYRAILRTVEGVQVWGGSAAAIVGAGQQDTAEVRLPGSVLAPSDYVLRLQGTSGTAVEDLDAYVFRVLR